MIVDAIICPKCKATVWSRYGHDMRYCDCGYCYIDGGRDYLPRIGYGGSKEWPGPWEAPQMVKLDVPEKAKK